MNPPFSAEELARVFAHTVSVTRAEEMARDALDGDLGPVQRGQSGLSFQARPSVSLSEDTLVLLSLESPQLEARVAEYRRALLGGRTESIAEEAEWLRRRTELKAWAEAGYPKAES